MPIIPLKMAEYAEGVNGQTSITEFYSFYSFTEAISTIVCCKYVYGVFNFSNDLILWGFDTLNLIFLIGYIFTYLLISYLIPCFIFSIIEKIKKKIKNETE